MKFESQLLKGVAPVVVLEILSRGPMYGYELGQAIAQRSENILSLGKGTLYPLLLDAAGIGKISVGPPYFNKVFVPLMLPLLAVLGIGPLTRWKQDKTRRIFVRLRAPLIASVVIGIGPPLGPNTPPVCARSGATVHVKEERRIPLFLGLSKKRWRIVPPLHL